MRIQHNIMAMNAYRNYTNNVNAMKSNLEKLSSGYKINRAGDDAAGLAISEKMRAQITGLETAQKNAKDGISLVQTAEGALTEVHDMLNRMVELATMSANGTYDNTTDRAQLQKEMDQLNSEINRIADSANFNGIKLLDGSMDANGRIANTVTTFTNLTGSSNVHGATVTDGVNKGFGGVNDKGSLKLTGGDLAATKAEHDVSDKSIRYHQDAKGAGKTSFTVDLTGLSHDIKAGTELKDMIFGLDSGTPASKAGTTATGTENNCLFINNKAASDAAAVEAAKLKYSVTAGADNKITGEDLAAAVEAAIKEAGGKVYIEIGGQGGAKRIEYTVTRDGGKLNFQMTEDGYNQAVENGDDENNFQGNFSYSVNYKSTAGSKIADKDELAFTKAVNTSLQGNDATCNINEGSKSSGTIYAQAYIRFSEASADATKGYNKATEIISDGKGLQIGDDYYIFAASDEVFNGTYADNVHVVDIRDLTKLSDLAATDAATKAAAEDDLRKALDRLTVAADSNEMFDVQVGKTDGSDKYYLVLNERTTYTGNANLTMKDFGLENKIGTFDGSVSKTTVTKEAGKALTLQIGDTAEDFNQLKVNIKDIHTSALGIDKIRIDDQTSAAAAIDVIKAAINKVSDIRGTLGATQNRLDHTINNLSVMTENIQDAESTIRDTDVAAEMMKYTKNNILIQSAQAMLAQANQVPQGVLQLLQ